MRSTHASPGVAVLYNATGELVKGEPQDLLAEKGVVLCAEAVSEALVRSGYTVARVPVRTDLELALAPYPPTEWMVFNLGEGLEGRLFEEPRIVWALEAMGYCYTGSDGYAVASSVDKARAKALLTEYGVATPPWWLLRHPDEVDRRAEDLPFPLIVKPVAEDASIGVGPGAVVNAVRALRDRVAYVVDCYRQAAVVERFIDGREFNVSLWRRGPRVLPLAEIDFSAFADPLARIVSFAAKWEAESFEYHHTPVVCPATVDAHLAARITETAVRAWYAIGCRGYARVDMRVGSEGVPQVVEVNCNPDLSREAGFHRATRAAGHTYEEMVTRIVETARRHYHACDRFGIRDRWAGHTETDGDGGHLHRRGTPLYGDHLEGLRASGRGQRLRVSGLP